MKKRSQSPLVRVILTHRLGQKVPRGRVIESIYTPTTPIKILLSDTDRVKRLKNDIGVLTIDNWLEMACKERRYQDPRPAENQRAHLDGLSDPAQRV